MQTGCRVNVSTPVSSSVQCPESSEVSPRTLCEGSRVNVAKTSFDVENEDFAD